MMSFAAKPSRLPSSVVFQAEGAVGKAAGPPADSSEPSHAGQVEDAGRPDRDAAGVVVGVSAEKARIREAGAIRVQDRHEDVALRVVGHAIARSVAAAGGVQRTQRSRVGRIIGQPITARPSASTAIASPLVGPALPPR